MSIFASRAQKTIDLPFDPPQTVTIQKLAGRHLEKARQESLFASFDYVKRVGGVAFQRELAAALGENGEPAETREASDAPAVAVDPLADVDLDVVLRHGIKAWTYDVEITPQALDDLTDEARDFLAREILRFTKPALFEEDATKKN